MSANQELMNVVDRVADIANSLTVKIGYFVIAGVIASSFLAWITFSLESALWWNILKCVFLFLPVLAWVVIWSILSQLGNAPERLSELLTDEQGEHINLGTFSITEPNGLRGLFSTIREFKDEDGLELIFDTISGVSLIANPLFVLLSFLSMGLILILILITPIVLLF